MVGMGTVWGVPCPPSVPGPCSVPSCDYILLLEHTKSQLFHIRAFWRNVFYRPWCFTIGSFLSEPSYHFLHLNTVPRDPLPLFSYCSLFQVPPLGKSLGCIICIQLSLYSCDQFSPIQSTKTALSKVIHIQQSSDWISIVFYFYPSYSLASSSTTLPYPGLPQSLCTCFP